MPAERPARRISHGSVASPSAPRERWSRQRLFRVFRRRLQPLWIRVFAQRAAAGDRPLPRLEDLRRVLLVFVNFRLGNNLIVTPAVDAITRGLPQARVDLAVAPGAACLFEGFRIGCVHRIGRFDFFLPLRLWRGVRALRRERYDAVIHLGGSAESLGALWVGLSRAEHRIGARGRRGNVHFTSCLPAPGSRHKVDQVLEFVRALGLPAEGERRIILHETERTWADAEVRRRIGESRCDAVGLFVGGRARKGKAWHLGAFGRLAAALRGAGFALLVFLGPDEANRRDEIERAVGPASFVEERSIRRVAALARCCRAVVAPDSGPMHLAIASGAPTVALFRKDNHGRWGPKPSHGQIVFDPSGLDWKGPFDAVLRLTERSTAQPSQAG